MNKIGKTSDGFILVKVPLTSIMETIKMEDIPSENYSYQRDDFDDWYIYSVSKEENTEFSILKMRELTDEANVGVSIPFISFDPTLIKKAIKSIEYGEKLSYNLEKMTEAKVDFGEHSSIIVEYFADPYSAANYLIAEAYIEKIIVEDCVDNRIKIPNGLSKRLKKYLDTIGETYDEKNNSIFINNTNNPTLEEEQAILAMRTANTSYNSFAAEVVFHAKYTTNFSKIGKRPIKKYYKSAVKADMGVGEERESGIFDGGYYNENGKYVKEQRGIWGKK